MAVDLLCDASLFAIGYWVVYPAWPGVTGFTHGLSGQSSRGDVAADVAAIQAQRAVTEAGLEDATLAQIAADKKLLSLALAHGKAAFADNCAPCHGAGGRRQGLPQPDRRRLAVGRQAGGHPADDHPRHSRLRRQGHAPERDARLRRDGILKPDQIQQVVSYVRTLSKLEPEAGVDVAAGKQIFADNCAACHGDDGKGKREFGSANLTDGLQLYGSDLKDLIQTVTFARNSTMPAWGARLDPVTIKTLAVYVHNLGAGE